MRAQPPGTGNIPRVARPSSDASTRSQHTRHRWDTVLAAAKEPTALHREGWGLQSATAQHWPWVSSQAKNYLKRSFSIVWVFFFSPEAPSYHQLLYSAKTPGIFSANTLCWPPLVPKPHHCVLMVLCAQLSCSPGTCQQLNPPSSLTHINMLSYI